MEELVTAKELATKRIRHACELDQGRIVRVSPAGRKHGLVLARILRLLVKHADKAKLGKVLSGETGFWVRRDPDSVRAPDAAFLSNETLARAERMEGAYFAVAPDLAVETGAGARVLGRGERIEGGSALPGFRVALRSFFEG